MKSILVPLFLLLSCSPVLPIVSPFQEGAESPKNPLRIVALDIGQGDATLVKGPDGTTLLIDAGPEGSGVAILQQMEEMEIERLDWILLTHFDIDHIGGIPEILPDYFPEEGFLDRGDRTGQDHPLFDDYLSFAGSDRLEVRSGEIISLGEGAAATVVVVNGRFADGRSIHLNPDEENESSVGLLIEYGSFRYLTLGDLTGGGTPGGFESKDLETWVGEIVGDVDILHLSHHGSETSTHRTFLEHITPEAAIISAGRNNPYGHPAPGVLERLNDFNCEIYRTDESGAITVTTSEDSYRIETTSQ